MFAFLSQKIRVPNYVFCAAIISVTGFIFGYDTGSIGSITLMPLFIETFGNFSSTIEGLLVSIILIPAAVISLGSGSISDRISRTYATSLGCMIYATGSLVCCLCGLNGQSQKAALVQVFLGRCISGAGEGIFLGAATVYGIEVAPHSARGRIGCLIQLGITSGIMSGYFTCYGSYNIPNSLSWRTPWILQTIVCILVASAVPWLPHSPRWLVHVGRVEEAKAVMRRLGLDEKELAVSDDSQAQKTHEQGEKGWRRHLNQWKSAFQPEVKGRTLLALFMLGVQQLSGIDGVLFYAPTLFKQAGLTSTNASFLASGVTGIVNVIFTLVGQTLSDRWGRRPALIFGGIAQAICMTTIGIIYALPTVSIGGQRTVIALIFIYFIAFVLTWAILMRTWVSESQPVRSRATVSSLALTVNWGTNFVVAFTTPMFLEASPSGPYFLWAGSLWVSVVVFAVFLPETRGQSIDGDEQNLNLEVEVEWLNRWRRGPACLGGVRHARLLNKNKRRRVAWNSEILFKRRYRLRRRNPTKSEASLFDTRMILLKETFPIDT